MNQVDARTIPLMETIVIAVHRLVASAVPEVSKGCYQMLAIFVYIALRYLPIPSNGQTYISIGRPHEPSIPRAPL